MYYWYPIFVATNLTLLFLYDFLVERQMSIENTLTNIVIALVMGYMSYLLLKL